MSKKLGILLITVALIIATVLTSAGPVTADDGPMIYLARATFDPLVEEPAFDGPLAALRDAAPDSDVFLLQFNGPVEDAWQGEIEAAGVELLSYIPDHAFVVRSSTLSPDAIASLPNVRWVGPYRAAYKLEQSLDAAMQSDEPMALTVSLFPGEDWTALEAHILSLDGTIEDIATSDLVGNAIRTTVSATAIADLALRSDVSWIEPYASMELDNDVARNIMGATGAQNVMSGLGTNLYGGGQIVSVADTGLDVGNRSTLSLDFRDTFVRAYAWGRTGVWDDPNGHGTHVAGSAVGSGRNSGSVPSTHSYGGTFSGVAPEAGLIFQSLLTSDGGLQTPSDLKQLFTPAHTDGARIHTNSWGHRTGGTSQNPTWGAYDSAARYADEFMYLNPTSLLLFSAGNNGEDANSDGVIDQDEIGSPGTAKNVLTVGATENNRPPGSGWGGYTNDVWGTGSWLALYPVDPIRNDYTSNNARGLAAFSSRGPTDDGRTKPDVVAPGTDIISSRSHASGASTGWGAYNSDYIYNGGTSMSTPLTAGAAALVRQFYTDYKSYANPSAALVKATIINGAANIAPGQYGTGSTQEIPDLTPNNVTGYGRVNLLNSMGLNSSEAILYWDNTVGLNTGGTATYSASLSQVGSGSQFAATVCWTDYPGTVGAGKALVNDLDFEVVTPTGTHYKGNGRAIWDRYNTCERVVLNNPEVGAYQLIVRAYSAPQGPQSYALIAQAEYMTSEPVTPLDPVSWLPLIMKTHGGPAPTATATTIASPTPTATPGYNTVTLSSVADSTILQGYPALNVGDTNDMWIGYDDQQDPDAEIVRGLVLFNVGSVPSGTVIDSATLRIYLISSWEFPDRLDTITAHRAAGNWTEMGVMWNNRPSVGTAYGSVNVPEDEWGWYELDVTALMRGWANGSIANQGIMIRGEEASGYESSWRGFSTREGTHAPELRVTYHGAAGSIVQDDGPTEGMVTDLSIGDVTGMAETSTDGRVLQSESD